MGEVVVGGGSMAVGSPTNMARIAHALMELDLPEVQRIRITAEEGSVWLDTRNRGGTRVAIVDAEPSREAAIGAARTLGIQVVD